MTLREIEELISSNSGFLTIALIIVLSLVEVSKIKINPWTWILKQLRRAVNGEVISKIEDIHKEVNDVKQDVKTLKDDADEREASNCRTHILRFGDDLLHNIQHSKEHYNHVLMAISKYEQYCEDHPHYMNHIASTTIEYIKHMYQKNLEDDNFLQ